MTVTTVPLAAAIAVEVTAATVVMNKSNRDISNRKQQLIWIIAR
jgi:hypothetical protein